MYIIFINFFQTLREELRSLKDLHQKHATLKDKQIEQLLDGFQKQMQLIDVLRRQKVRINIFILFCYWILVREEIRNI